MEDEQSFVCVLCPRGCTLKVARSASGELAVGGNGCPRGEAYGRSEILDPRRSLTTTVRTAFADRPRAPVKSSAPLPKARLADAVRALDELLVTRRLRCGDVVATDILGLGVDIVATDDLD